MPLDAPGHRENLGDIAAPIHAAFDVTHEVDRRGQRGRNECGRHVFTGEQRQDRELVERLPRRVGMHGCHTRHTRVEGNEEVEGFGAANLTDDQVLGAHTQRFAHEVTQANLSRSLCPGRARLHRNMIPIRQAQLEDLLAGDNPTRTRQLTREGTQQRRLTGLGTAGHEHGEATADGSRQEVTHRRGDHLHRDQVLQCARPLDVLTNVDTPRRARHRWNDDVEALSTSEHRVHEGARQVESAARMVQHSLHESPHVLVSEDEAGQLGHARSSNEHS